MEGLDFVLLENFVDMFDFVTGQRLGPLPVF